VNDFGKSSDGVFFLVMEYVEGESLYQLLRREGTLNPLRAAAIMRQVVAGVEAAHDAGILHRDLKPANIFIMQKRKRSGSASGAEAEDGFVKVGDFGLAKIVNSERSAGAASGPASRGILGTPEYMAPEQMQPGVELDVRADVYALGAIAYHMLGGRPPFTGDMAQLIAQKLMQEPPSLTGLRSDIATELEKAVMHALAREVTARPATASDWLDEFDSAAGRHSGQLIRGDSRVVIMAPTGAEVYVDDERQGSVGRSGRVILTSIAAGRHVLRVAKTGEVDDERVIEVRPDGAEQIIQAQFKSPPSSTQLTPSRGGSLDSRTGPKSTTLVVVVCMRCNSRFAEGLKFCGVCGNTTFRPVTPTGALPPTANQLGAKSEPARVTCNRCGQNYSSGTKFCGRCGIPLGAPLDWSSPRPVEILCKLCSTSYPAGTKFCGRCGKPISP
jgi:serine/threonine protein kinase/ribosomal protein L37E/ribosomal protein L40E